MRITELEVEEDGRRVPLRVSRLDEEGEHELWLLGRDDRTLIVTVKNLRDILKAIQILKKGTVK